MEPAEQLLAELAELRAENQRLREEAATSAPSNDRFRVLFEHSSDAHLIFDDTGILDCNRAAVKTLRCDDKKHVLRLHPAVLSPEFQPDGRRSLEKSVEMDALARERGFHRFSFLHLRSGLVTLATSLLVRSRSLVFVETSTRWALGTTPRSSRRRNVVSP